MPSQAPRYHGYRFPSEIISHAVWLYHRFALSFRDVEDLLAQRSITVTYETIRQWCLSRTSQFASASARCAASSRPPTSNASGRSTAWGRISSEFVDICCGRRTTVH